MAPVVKLANYQDTHCDRKTFKMKMVFSAAGQPRKTVGFSYPMQRNNFVYQNIFSICKLLPNEVHNPNKQLADVI